MSTSRNALIFCAAAFVLGTRISAASPFSSSASSAFSQERQMSYTQLLHRWDPLISQASARFGVPESWIRIVMQVESGGRTMTGEKEPIISRAGAMGLMQLMPATYRDMRAEFDLGPDPFAPRDNIFAGTAYLRWLNGKYGYPAMFAAYNDGPGNLEARLMNAGLLPGETRSYVARVTAALEGRGFVVARGKPVRFTRPNGLPVIIDPTQVISIRAALPEEYAPGVQTVIAFGRVKQGVCENLAQVKGRLHLRGTSV